MEDFPTLQGPRNSTMGLEVISPSVGQGETTVIKTSAGWLNDDKECLKFSPNFQGEMLSLVD